MVTVPMRLPKVGDPQAVSEAQHADLWERKESWVSRTCMETRKERHLPGAVFPFPFFSPFINVPFPLPLIPVSDIYTIYRLI